MVGPADEGYAAAAGVDEVLGGLLGCHVAVGLDRRELLGQAGAPEEDQGDAHVADFLEVAVVGGGLGEAGYDALHVHADEVVECAGLGFKVFVAIGTDDTVAGACCLGLDAGKDGSVVVGL